MFGYIRFLLAYFVLLSHLNVKFLGHNIGVFAVIIFYILAGLVTAKIFIKFAPAHAPFNYFIKDRFLRIYPTYLLVLLLTIVFFLFTSYWDPKFHFKNLIYHFSVVPLNYYFYLDVNVIKMPTGPNFLNPPAWSLGAELQAYLLLVLAIKFRMLGFILAIFSFCVFAIANLGFINSDIFGYRLVCGVFFIFYTGLLIFNKEYKKLSFFYILSIILLLTLIIKGSFGIYSIETLSGYLIGVGLVLTHEKLKLKLKFNEVFGSISYSLFICHTLFIWFCDLVLKSQNLILITFFCIIFGLANYFLVEKSINKIRFG